MADDSSSHHHTTSNEDLVTKYKKLLNIAKNSLEANQGIMAAKDKTIEQLKAALDEERLRKGSMKNSTTRDEEIYPRRILCRVDIEGLIWILIEYENADNEWKSFTDEQNIKDFMKRLPGIPLILPQKCLTSEESSLLIEDCKKKMERIMEEYRRYKVKMELQLKQRDNEQKPISLASFQQLSISNSHTNKSNTTSLTNIMDRAMTQGNTTMFLSSESNNNHQSSQQYPSQSQQSDELQQLKYTMQEQEKKWKLGYEKLSKENELLKSKGADSVVATQWRLRYETCQQDKEELSKKLDIYTELSNEITRTGKTLEELYIDLYEDFKDLKYKLKLDIEKIKSYLSDPFYQTKIIDCMHMMIQYIDERFDQYNPDHSLSASSASNNITFPSSGPSLHYDPNVFNHSDGGGTGKGIVESKIQYIRQMFFQYLICKEPEVKTHIESALMTLFRYNEQERVVIDSKRKEVEAQSDPLTSITSFIGSFAG